MKKLNLAKVRSAIGATIALAFLALAAPAAAQSRPPEAFLLWLPAQTTVAELADAGLSPGLMSPGLGTVPAQQTYLDVGQGNRVFDSLYDGKLPVLGGDCESWWREVVERGSSAPAEIVPGLLTSTLKEAGFGVQAGGGMSCAFSAHPQGEGERPSLVVAEGTLADLPRPQGGDLVIAIAGPTGKTDDLLPIGIRAPGFDGDLTSGSTRTDGYVLSTDVAPTILDFFGLEIPSEVAGQAIESEGSVDPAAIESLGARMAVISERRGPVIGCSLLLWLGLLVLVAAVTRGRAARAASAWSASPSSTCPC